MGAVRRAADAPGKQGEKWHCPYGRVSQSILPAPLRWGFLEEARRARFLRHTVGREHPRTVCAKASGGKELFI